ncbi:hypothetical protein WR25_26822 isoform A [Diploscapter pachys]|nr:hypothetical protein WR25_26822 isoform A [Diploscapter pachys]
MVSNKILDKILMGLISAALVALGIAFCLICPAGGLWMIAGSGLLAGGISGVMAALAGADWGQFWRAVGCGIIAGVISGIASPFIAQGAAYFGSLAGNAISKYLIHLVISGVMHAGVAFITNGIQNLIHGQPFTANWRQAVICGAVIGIVSSVVYIINDIGIEQAIERARNFFEELRNIPGFERVTELTNRIISYLPESLQTVARGGILLFQRIADSQIIGVMNSLRTVEIFANFAVSAISQYIMFGNVSFGLALMQGVAYGLINSRNRSQAGRTVPKSNVVSVEQTVPHGIIFSGDTSNTIPRNEDNVQTQTTISQPQQVPNPPAPTANVPEHVSESPTKIPNVSNASVPTPTHEEPQRDPGIETKTTEEKGQEAPKTTTPNVSAANATTPTREESHSKLERIETKTTEGKIREAPKTTTPNVSAANTTTPTREESHSKLERIETKTTEEKGQEVSKAVIFQEIGDSAGQFNQAREYIQNIENFYDNDELVYSFTEELKEFRSIVAQADRQRINEIERLAPRQQMQYSVVSEERPREGIPVSNENRPAVSTSRNNSNQNPSFGTHMSTSTSQLSNPNSSIPNNRLAKTPIISPLIIFNETEEKYQLVNPNLWPIFPNNGLKVITMSGTRRSGRTSFIHAMAYEMGYVLTKEQMSISRISSGVTMYLFSEEQLLILDCHEGIGFVDDECTVPAVFTLELFCYLISDHRIHHTFGNHKNFEKQIEQCEKTMRAFYRAGTQFELHGGRLVTLLFRCQDALNDGGIKKFEKICKGNHEKKEKWRKKLEKRAEKVKSPSKYSKKDDQGNPINRNKEKDEKKLAEAIEERSYDLYIEQVMFLPDDNSKDQKVEFHEQCNTFVKAVQQSTPIHHTFETQPEQIDAEKPTFSELVTTVWANVAQSEDLFKCISKALNQSNAKKEDDIFDVESYLEAVIKSFRHHGRINKIIDWIVKEAEKEAKKKNDTNCAYLFIGISRLGTELLELRRSISDNETIRANCINLGFQGLTLFFGKDTPQFELLAIKASIKEANALDTLTDDLRFSYQSAWVFLNYAAYYGFRMELIKYGLLDHAIRALKKNHGSIPRNFEVEVAVYDTLNAMMYLNITKLLIGWKAPKTENKRQVDNDELIELLYEFEKKSEQLLVPLKNGRNFVDVTDLSRAYQQMLEFPREYFDKTDYARRQKVSFDDLDPPVKYKFETAILRYLYEAIGYFVANKIIDNWQEFTPKATYDAKVCQSALKMWTGVASMTLAFEDLLGRIIRETKLKDWLMTYRSNLLEPNLAPCLKLCNTLMGSEFVHKVIPDTNSTSEKGDHDMTHFEEVAREEKRKQLIDHYRHTALEIVDKTDINAAVKKFKELAINEDRVEEAEAWINHFEFLLKQGVDKDDKTRCIYSLLNNRLVIVKKVAQIAEFIAKTMDKLPPQIKPKAIRVLFASAQLVNRLMIMYEFEDLNVKHKSFFNSNGDVECDDETVTDMWKALMKLFAVITNQFLRKKQEIRNSSELEEHYFDQNFMFILCFIYNLAVLSKRCAMSSERRSEHGEIISDMGTVLNRSDRKLIVKIDEFCQISIYDDKTNHKWIIRTAAYIWANYASNIEQRLVEPTFNEECNILCGEFDHNVKIWRDKVARNANLERCKQRMKDREDNDGKTVAHFEQLIQQQLNQQVHPLDDEERRRLEQVRGRLAIESVHMIPYGHEDFNGIELPLESYRESFPNALREILGIGKTAACLLACTNPKDKVQDQFVNYFDKVQRKELQSDDEPILKLRTIKNSSPNKIVEDMVGLKNADMIFEWFGFTKTSNSIDGIKYTATVESIGKIRNEVEIFVKEVESLARNKPDLHKGFGFRLNSKFTEVASEVADERSFDLCTLPTGFVDRSISNLTIGELKGRYSKITDVVAKMPYSLVRITLPDGKVVQKQVQFGVMGFFGNLCRGIVNVGKAIGRGISKVATGVKNFVCRHAKKLIAGAMVVVGAVLCVATGGLAAPIGAGLICGGLSGLVSSFSKNSTWASFGKAVLGGFLAGAVTTLAAPLVATLAAAAGGGIVGAAVSAACFAGVGVLTGGISNIIHGQNFFNGWKSSAIAGAVVGLISSCINHSTINQHTRSLFDRIENLFGYQFIQGRIEAVLNYGIRVAVNIGVSAAIQKITAGKVSWSKALLDGVVYSYVNNRLATKNVRGIDQPVQNDYSLSDEDKKQTKQPDYIPVEVPPQPVPGRPSTTPQQQPPVRTPTQAPPVRTPTQAPPVRTSEPAPPVRTPAPAPPNVSQGGGVPEPQTKEPNQTVEKPAVKENKSNIDVQQPKTSVKQQSSENRQQETMPAQQETPVRQQATTTAQPNVSQSQSHLEESKQTRTDSTPLHNTSRQPETSTTTPATPNKLQSATEMPADRPSLREVPAAASQGKTITTQSDSSSAAVPVEESHSVRQMPLATVENIAQHVDVNRQQPASEQTTSIQQAASSSTRPEIIKPETSRETNRRELRQAEIRQPSQNSELIGSILDEIKYIEKEKHRIENAEIEASTAGRVHQLQHVRARVRVHNTAVHDPGQRILSDGTIGQKPAFTTGQNQSDHGQRLGGDQTPGTSESQQTSQRIGLNPQQQQFKGDDMDEQDLQDLKGGKIVLTIPLIKYNEDANQYQILNWQDWPKLPEKLRVLTVSGAHQSGRTSLIHSLIYHWGYKLMKSQILVTRLRMG